MNSITDSSQIWDEKIQFIELMECNLGLEGLWEIMEITRHAIHIHREDFRLASTQIAMALVYSAGEALKAEKIDDKQFMKSVEAASNLSKMSFYTLLVLWAGKAAAELYTLNKPKNGLFDTEGSL